MRTIRMILTAVCLTALLHVSAQNAVQYASIQMHSTSAMAGSGSSLPLAAVDGATTTDDAGSPKRVRGMRKVEENPFGDETINDISTPQEPGTPIGDGLWYLLCLAAAYALCKRYNMSSQKRLKMFLKQQWSK